MSDFAVGIKQPKFELIEARITSRKITTGDATKVRVTIRNEGEADGTYRVKLLLDGEVVERRDVPLGAGGATIVTFEQSIDQAGTYTVKVNERTVDEVVVSEDEVDGTATETSDDGTGIGVPGFTPLQALLALLATVALVGARRRRER
jgi:hypothetical protein